MVSAMNRISWPRRFSFSAQCAIVTVTPELSSSSVLIAGMPHAPIGENCSMKPGPAEGQCGVKPGHISALLSMVARSGTEYWRTHHSAPKKAPKNITSEKMNHLMPQRNERTSQAQELPPADARLT